MIAPSFQRRAIRPPGPAALQRGRNQGASSALRRVGSTPGLALLIATMAAATLLTVWAMQHAGYVPCELCLLERNPYDLGVPLALATAGAARRGALRLGRAGFWGLTILFVVSTGLAAYHAGVEYQVWAGPTGCSGPMPASSNVSDFLQQLKTVKVVRCDAPALVIFGLSLAGWNVLVSLLLAALSAWGARVTGRAITAA